MSEKAPIVQLERDFADNCLIVKRADGAVERVQPEQLKGLVTWDAAARKAGISYALKDLVVVDG